MLFRSKETNVQSAICIYSRESVVYYVVYSVRRPLAIGLVSRFLGNLGLVHWRSVNRILRYVRKTMACLIRYVVCFSAVQESYLG